MVALLSLVSMLDILCLPLCEYGCRVSDDPRNCIEVQFRIDPMFTGVKESVCIAILSLVSLASSSATCIAVISTSCTDVKSLSLMIMSSSLCTTAVPSRVQSIPHSYGSCFHGAVSCFCSCVGSSNCLGASR